jgi:hypothetical protein
MDAYLAKFEHIDTYIVEVPIATNFLQDVEHEEKRNDKSKENEHKLTSSP